MKNLLVKSYAKINIALKVTGIREDGYHNIDTIMIPLKLHDCLLMSELKKGNTGHSVTMDDYSILDVSDNVVTKSLIKFLDYIKSDKKFRFDIHKAIPPKSGLGGGSSNAAFAMIGVNKFLKANISNEEIFELCKPIGSDVPFFVKCEPSRCQGKGEIITPIILKNEYYVLLVKPEQGCKTVKVYEKYESKPKESKDILPVIEALETGDDEKLAQTIFNDLEESAIDLVPEIKIIKEKLKEIGFSIVSMTGSGSCVFAMSHDKKLIHKAARKLENSYQVLVTKTLK